MLHIRYKVQAVVHMVCATLKRKRNTVATDTTMLAVELENT